MQYKKMEQKEQIQWQEVIKFRVEINGLGTKKPIQESKNPRAASQNLIKIDRQQAQ